MKSTAQSQFRAGVGPLGALHHPPGSRRRCRRDQTGVEVLVHRTSISGWTDISRCYGSSVRRKIDTLGRRAGLMYRRSSPSSLLIKRLPCVWLVSKSPRTQDPPPSGCRRDQLAQLYRPVPRRAGCAEHGGQESGNSRGRRVAHDDGKKPVPLGPGCGSETVAAFRWHVRPRAARRRPQRRTTRPRPRVRRRRPEPDRAGWRTPRHSGSPYRAAA
jgi:hypothetical protein